MRLVQARFVTACQQLLALGVVLAVLTPASGVVSLDIVGEHPGATGRRRGRRRSSGGAALGHACPTAVGGARPSPRSRSPAARRQSPAPWPAAPWSVRRSRAAGVTSKPQDVTGYGAVGVTWAHGEDLADEPDRPRRCAPAPATPGATGRPGVPRRARPDAGSAEAATPAPGHRPAVRRQRRRRAGQGPRRAARSPDDLSLAVVDPGRADATETEAPADRRAATPVRAHDYDGAAARETATARTAASSCQAATQTTRPADHLLAAPSGAPTSGSATRARCATARSAPASSTTRSTPTTTPRRRCPAIIRSIYAYHVKSRGWSDIGYNFLVDRFGRIWEGRYGGIDKPGRRRAHAQLQRLLLRDVGDRQLRHRPAARRRCSRPTARCSRGSSACTGSTRPRCRSRSAPHLRGHQRPPRRRLDRLPRQVPLRQDPRHPGVRRRRRRRHPRPHRRRRPLRCPRP